MYNSYRYYERRFIGELFDNFLNLYRYHEYKKRKVLNITLGIIAFLFLLYYSNLYISAHSPHNELTNKSENTLYAVHLGSVDLSKAIETGVEDQESHRVHRRRGRSYTTTTTFSYLLVPLNDGSAYIPVRIKKSHVSSRLAAQKVYGSVCKTSDNIKSSIQQRVSLLYNVDPNKINVCDYSLNENATANSLARPLIFLIITVWCIADGLYCVSKINAGYTEDIKTSAEDTQIKRTVSSMGIDYTQLNTMNDDLDDWMQREEKKQQHMDQNIDNQGFESWKDQKEDNWKARVEAENKQNTDDDYYSSSLSLKHDK